MIVIIMMVMVKVVVVLCESDDVDVDIPRWVWRFAGRKALLGGRSLRKRHTGETNKQQTNEKSAAENLSCFLVTKTISSIITVCRN